MKTAIKNITELIMNITGEICSSILLTLFNMNSITIDNPITKFIIWAFVGFLIFMAIKKLIGLSKKWNEQERIEKIIKNMYDDSMITEPITTQVGRQQQLRNRLEDILDKLSKTTLSDKSRIEINQIANKVFPDLQGNSNGMY